MQQDADQAAGWRLHVEYLSSEDRRDEGPHAPYNAAEDAATYMQLIAVAETVTLDANIKERATNSAKEQKFQKQGTTLGTALSGLARLKNMIIQNRPTVEPEEPEEIAAGGKKP